MNHVRIGIAASLLTCVPSIAYAHTGIGVATGLVHGVAHPLSGADHLLAMVAVGILATQLGRRALWALPATFVGLMIGGFVLAASGIALPGVELVIMASVIVLGTVVARAGAMPMIVAVAMVGTFALFHGHAHGAEMPGAVHAGTYLAGFALATALLHGAGIGLTLALRTRAAPRHALVERLAGVAIVLAGIGLLLG